MTNRQTEDKYEFDVELSIPVLEQLLEMAKEAKRAGTMRRNRKGEEVFPVFTVSTDRSFGRHCPGRKGVCKCGGKFAFVEDVGWRTVVEYTEVRTLKGVEKRVSRVMVRDQPCCKLCRR